jgi:D-arginine dehydrogenase
VMQSFYIKPDAGMLLGSPCNEDPVQAHDVQAEDLDIAIAIDNIERLTSLRIRRPTHIWAGLRSFVADGELVGGFDPRLPGFFWAAGQGGYGIQSAPGAGRYYASVLLGGQADVQLASFGFDPARISPARFQS